MNPFDLRGPEFLIFYGVLCSGLLGSLYFLKEGSSVGDLTAVQLTDPYLIAYLRGGNKAVAEAVVISLIDRGLIKIKNEKIEVIEKLQEDKKYPKVETLLLKELSKKEVNSIVDGDDFCTACERFQRPLRQYGLLLDDRGTTSRTLFFVFSILVMIGVAATKILIAISRGHSNVQFLFILACVFVWMAAKLKDFRRTGKGNRLLEEIRILYRSLKERGSSLRFGKDSGELPMLVAVYGVSSLPSSTLIDMNQLFPHATGLGAGDSGSWGDSSCSSCSSCGSGCGGGCGGCGS